MQKMLGTLADEDIRKEIENARLITENFDLKCIKQACYELRASTIYYLPQDGNKRIELKEDDYILIKPKSIIVILTMETISLESDMLGRIMTKGSLFSLGISAINTYADPGFQGKLGIVFQNQSNYYLKIKQGESIAKIEFSRLAKPVMKPYHGQHGYETGIWPIKKELILSDEEIKSDNRIKGDIEEITDAFGNKVGNAFSRVLKIEKRISIMLGLYFTFNFWLLGISFYLMNGNTDLFNPIITIGFGLATNFIWVFMETIIKRK